METLIVVPPQHRNQYYGRSKYGVRGRFSSPSSSGLRDINCRFQSGSSGILPTPLRLFNGSFVAKMPFSSPTTTQGPGSPISKGKKLTKYNEKSTGIPITLKSNDRIMSFDDNLSSSKLWAGPAYSYSPPPSSLPMPKFSLRPKRCVSSELRVPAASGSPSSTGEPDYSASNFILSTDFATKDLRRILHLDVGDE